MGGGTVTGPRYPSNWHHAVTVTLPIIGESNKIKSNKNKITIAFHSFPLSG